MSAASQADSLYGDRANLYDLLYHFKDYRAEADAIRALLVAEGVPEGSRILEAGCGTGIHLSHLAPFFQVSGFDLNDGMLGVARGRLPDATLWRADMAGFSVDEPVDAVISLFSCIGYLTHESALRSAAACFHAAIRPGGLLIVEPWLTPEQWRTGMPSLQTYDSPTLKLARGTVGSLDGDVSVFDMHWLVVAEGRPVEHFVDRHRLWLCPRPKMAAIFEGAGFEVDYLDPGLPKGRGLFVGRRR